VYVNFSQPRSEWGLRLSDDHQIVIDLGSTYTPRRFLRASLTNSSAAENSPVKPIASKDGRPVNLDIGTMKLPITAWASISHRISGVILFFASVLMVWALDMSLESEASFRELVALLTSPLAKLVTWAIAMAISYHTLAGIKHLIADMGYGEELDEGVLMARLVFALTAVAAVAWGIIIW
jgi:succinate dehydrogenase / fumarate reductase cytochrome b subunit